MFNFKCHISAGPSFSPITYTKIVSRWICDRLSSLYSLQTNYLPLRRVADETITNFLSPLHRYHTHEVRSVAPDANPYMLMYSLIKVGLEGPKPKSKSKNSRIKTRPGNIYDAIRVFKSSKLTKEILGQRTAGKYIKLKEASAYKCSRELGTTVKRSEIIYHHEITNQYLWSRF